MKHLLPARILAGLEGVTLVDRQRQSRGGSASPALLLQQQFSFLTACGGWLWLLWPASSRQQGYQLLLFQLVSVSAFWLLCGVNAETALCV